MPDQNKSNISASGASQLTLKPIKVLAVVPGDENEPSSMVFARRQISHLRKNGIAIQTFFLPSRTSIISLTHTFREFRREVNRFDPDIVHAHFGTMTAFFCAVATRRPLVISFRGSDLNPTRNVSRYRSALARLLSQLAALRANHVICVSQQLKDRLWARACPTSVIFDGVDLSIFQPVSRSEARQILGWNHSSPRIFFNLGGRPKVKRLDLAKSAMNVVCKEMPDADLVAVSNVDPNMIPLIMNACDCLLLTSDWEGSPTVVKEALACNLPIVSVDVGDVINLVEGVHPSHIVPRDPEAIGAALLSVLRMEERSNGFIKSGEVSEATVGNRILEVYEKALS